MEKLGLNELRKMFLDFYESKGHYRGKSASLIPKNDNSLLIINSGMAPLKPYFSGVETPPSKRMTTCQKCIRTGDIDNVGITSRHGTFFEMLGNFSFGDYFKKESLTWGWEFITQYLKLPEDRIWATIYHDDDQAYEIWRGLGLPDERIVRLGKEDNFWEIGLGPCGPDSEIFFDRGPEYGEPDDDFLAGCEHDRYIEFWNHVFTQFSKEEDGSYSDLAHPNIDTGMGLERLACIMQGVDSIFDIDTIRYILDAIVELCGIPYESGNDKADISIRIITDHLRSTVFMIADNITPSNEGRGYVLRRLIRRAARHGRMLGIPTNAQGGFLADLADRVIEVSGEAYPELVEKQDYIKNIIRAEEKQFAQTLDQGESIIQSYIEEMKKDGSTMLSGENSFKLYDTFGFPLELTEEILADEGFTCDVDGFNACMQKQKDTSRKGRKNTEELGWEEAEEEVDVPETVFTGYDHYEDFGRVLALYVDGKPCDKAEAGSNAVVYLDRTPFYAESGGQIYDIGFMSTDSDTLMKVTGVEKSKGIFGHQVYLESGSVSVGDSVNCHINRVRRNKIARNHTATHLLQKALQKVLGNHVEQAGSSVTDKELRFDFNHFEAVSKEDLEKIEQLVNEKICEFLPVSTIETSVDEARKMGAMALFGEKYGEVVRVVNCGDWSIELCGGTHVSNTGQIGAMKITSESGVASGVRRITAVTGTGVLEAAQKAENTIAEVASSLKSKPNQVENRAASLMDELKAVKKELEEFKKAAMGSETDDIIASAKQIGDLRLITKEFADYNIGDLRNLSDEIRKQEKGVVMVFAAVTGGKVTLLCSVTDDLLDKGIHAGKLIKQIAAKVGGGGGGKADMAQAGGKNPAGISDAFSLAEQLLA